MHAFSAVLEKGTVANGKLRAGVASQAKRDLFDLFGLFDPMENIRDVLGTLPPLGLAA